MPVQIQLRRDTAANWASTNPTLASGELGLETDTKGIKIGDGATAWNSLAYSLGSIGTINVIIDGAGSAITTGIKGDMVVDFACTIKSVTLLADQTGSVVVNIWKQAYGSYPPTVTQKITASAPPTITTALKSQDSTLTGWTTSISAGDVLRFNVDSCTTITRVLVALKVLRG